VFDKCSKEDVLMQLVMPDKMNFLYYFSAYSEVILKCSSEPFGLIYCVDSVY
jgi:hypothetical protein